MRKYLNFLFITVIIILGCGKDKYQSQWASQPLAVDGGADDWQSQNPYFWEDDNITFAFQNDAENLYLMFQFTDERLARRIRMLGVTAWLNVDGKKDKKYGVLYAGGPEPLPKPEMAPDEDRAPQMEEYRQRMQERMTGDLPGADKIILVHNKQKTEITANNTQGPASAAGRQNGLFRYEFRIPIPAAIKPNKPIKIGLVFGGPGDQDRNKIKQDMRDRGGRPGGMGRPGGIERPDGGGGRMGGRPGMGRPDGPPREDGLSGFEKKEIWLDLVLAPPAN